MIRTRFYTIMVVAHRGRRTRSFVVSRPFLATLAALVLFLVAGGALFPGLYLGYQEQDETIGGLRARNNALTASLGEVDDQLIALRGQMEFYEREADKLALLAGLEPLPRALQATGGAAAPGNEPADLPPGVRGTIEELESLAVRKERLTHNFVALASQYEKLAMDLASIPSISPVDAGYLGSSYGWRNDPFTGRRVFHQGQDIVARNGTPVLAPARGKVTRAGRRGGLGLTVSLSHGNRLVSRYGHMSRITVAVGQWVQRGDVIGYVGSTGRSLGSHLHYEVFQSGQQVDPLDFILMEPQPPIG